MVSVNDKKLCMCSISHCIVLTWPETIDVKWAPINWLASGRAGNNHKSVFSEQILRVKFMNTSCEIVLGRLAKNTFADNSIMVQVMACCHQATSHYLSQCWSKFMASLGHEEFIVHLYEWHIQQPHPYFGTKICKPKEIKQSLIWYLSCDATDHGIQYNVNHSW